MAGNIIPAIATTNAVIAGCILTEAIKILNNQVPYTSPLGVFKKDYRVPREIGDPDQDP
jgi:ubiquitin-like 1-activating enzyme E1 B